MPNSRLACKTKTLFMIKMAKIDLTNRMWISVVCTLIDNDMRHHTGQNVVDSLSAAPRESTTNFDHCDDAYRCR